MTPPAKLQKAVESYIHMWGRRKSHGLIRRIIRPHPLYRYAPGPNDRPNQIRFASIGWRVFLKSRSGQVTAVDAIRRKGGAYGFRFYVGEIAAHWLNRLRVLEKRKPAAAGKHEARLLNIPAVHLSLVWLVARSKQKDLFARLDTGETGSKTHWMTRNDLDGLIRAHMSSAAKMWDAAREQ